MPNGPTQRRSVPPPLAPKQPREQPALPHAALDLLRRFPLRMRPGERAVRRRLLLCFGLRQQRCEVLPPDLHSGVMIRQARFLDGQRAPHQRLRFRKPIRGFKQQPQIVQV